MPDEFHFGEFVLDVRKRELRKDGAALELSSMVFDFLHYLIDARDRVVPKEELLERFWPDTVVSDTSLAQLIRKARRFVDDDGDTQRVIKTVRGRGIRFVMDVEDGVGAVETAAPARVAAPPQARPDFIGRSPELDVLSAAVDEAHGGHGAVVLLMGPAGIGKTSLAERFATIIEERVPVYWGHSDAHAGAPAFWPWIQVLRQLTRERGAKTVAALAGPDLREIARLLPELGGEVSTREEVAVLEASQAQFALLDGATRLLIEAARDRCVVVVLEDLHFADSASVNLLRFLARAVSGSGLVIVATCRPDETIDLGTLERETSVRRVELAGLTEKEIVEFMAVHGYEAVAPASELRKRTDGNPLFLRQVLETSGSSERALSHALGTVLDQRVASLDPGPRSLLDLASVIGRTFPQPLLEQGLAEPPEQVRVWLDALTRQGLLRDSVDVVGGLEFAHALVHEALYRGLSTNTRRELHYRILELLEARPAEVDAAVLAHHASCAAPLGDSRARARYCAAAAEDAMSRRAYALGAEHYQAVLAALPPDPRRQSTERAEVLFKTGEAHWAAGAVASSEESFEEADEIARNAGDAVLRARIALAARPVDYTMFAGWTNPRGRRRYEEALATLPDSEVSLRARLQSNLAMALHYPVAGEGVAPDIDAGLGLAREATALAEGAGDVATLSMCRFVEIMCSQSDGAFRHSSDDLDALVRLSDEGREPQLSIATRRLRIANDLRAGDGVRLRQHLEDCRVIMERSRLAEDTASVDILKANLAGQLDQADALIHQALAHAMQEGSSLALHTHSFQLFILRREQGRMQEAEPQIRGALQLLPHHIGLKLALALMLMQKGARDDACDEVREIGRHPILDNPSEGHWLPSLCYYAELSAELGLKDELLRCRQLLGPVKGRHATLGYVTLYCGPVDYFLSLVEQALGNFDAAVEHAETAASALADLGAPLRESLAHVARARSLRSRGRPDDLAEAEEILAAQSRRGSGKGWPQLEREIRDLSLT